MDKNPFIRATPLLKATTVHPPNKMKENYFSRHSVAATTLLLSSLLALNILSNYILTNSTHGTSYNLTIEAISAIIALITIAHTRSEKMGIYSISGQILFLALTITLYLYYITLESSIGYYILALGSISATPRIALHSFSTAVMEEMFFRKLLTLDLSKSIPPAFAVVISTALFTLAHGVTNITLIFSGLVWGIAALHFKSVATPIAIHFIHDGLYLIKEYAQTQQNTLSPYTSKLIAAGFNAFFVTEVFSSIALILYILMFNSIKIALTSKSATSQI